MDKRILTSVWWVFGGMQKEFVKKREFRINSIDGGELNKYRQYFILITPKCFKPCTEAVAAT